jgi:transposase-like protein
MAIRQRARLLIDAIVEEELEQALGAAPSVRREATRTGYRHGTRERTLTTSLGPTTFAMPRGATGDGRGDDRGMAQRVGAPVSAAECAGG